MADDEEDNVYIRGSRDDLVSDDAISVEEQGFVEGYDDDEDDSFDENPV